MSFVPALKILLSEVPVLLDSLTPEARERSISPI